MKIGRRILDSDVPSIANFLQGHQDVTSLDLSFNKITNSGVSCLMEFLKDSNIKALSLVFNEIDFEGIEHIVALGEKLPFHVLRVSGNNFGEKGGEALSKLLRMRTSLKSLDLSDTRQNIKSLVMILSGLIPNRGGDDNLKQINIGRPKVTNFEPVCSAHIAQILGQVLQVNSTLEELYIQKYRFCGHDIENLAYGLMFNTTLQVLDLNNNRIGDDGVRFLCKYFDTRPSLSFLMISANGVSDTGARNLSFSMNHSRLIFLDITNNKLTDDGILCLLCTIRKQAISLWGNQMTHKSLVFLERMLMSGSITSDLIDVRMYEVDGILYPAWNSSIASRKQKEKSKE